MIEAGSSLMIAIMRCAGMRDYQLRDVMLIEQTAAGCQLPRWLRAMSYHSFCAAR
jgi:hypothetical protein